MVARIRIKNVLKKLDQKRICIAPYIPQMQRRLADGLIEVGAMIQISFSVFFLKVSTVLVSTTSTGRQGRRHHSNWGGDIVPLQYS